MVVTVEDEVEIVDEVEDVVESELVEVVEVEEHPRSSWSPIDTPVSLSPRSVISLRLSHSPGVGIEKLTIAFFFTTGQGAPPRYPKLGSGRLSLRGEANLYRIPLYHPRPPRRKNRIPSMEPLQI